jgi:hypothetical protein
MGWPNWFGPNQTWSNPVRLSRPGRASQGPDPTSLSLSPLSHAYARVPHDLLLARRCAPPAPLRPVDGQPWRRCSRTRSRHPLLFLLHQLPLTATPLPPTLAPKAPPCRRLFLAALGPFRLRRLGLWSALTSSVTPSRRFDFRGFFRSSPT